MLIHIWRQALHNSQPNSLCIHISRMKNIERLQTIFICTCIIKLRDTISFHCECSTTQDAPPPQLHILRCILGTDIRRACKAKANAIKPVPKITPAPKI